MSQYCPLIIWPDGNVFESSAGHLQMLVALSGDDEILKSIPKNVSPLLYLTAKFKCVVVDYENQIYVGELTDRQQNALDRLSEVGLIMPHLVNMPEKMMYL